MVRRRNREKKPSKTLSEFRVVFEPVFLPPEENSARIEKLADLLLKCLASAKHGCKTWKEKASGGGLLEVNHDEIFGLA